ncbi:MAG: hypothetical protein K2O84_01655 [Oscillospiraceae bacterium]|nr:hypothetical protein [Oscillospiraceae bacterium]
MNIGSIFGSYHPSTVSRRTGTRSDRDVFYNGMGNLDGLMRNRTNAYILSSRPQLTDREIYEFARKYDFRHMTQESYDAFLDDLVQKGVLTRAETEYFGYGGQVRLEDVDSRLCVMRLAGMEEPYSQNTPFLEDGAVGDGNMVAWLAQMIPGVDGGARDPEGMKRAFQRLEMYGALIDVVYRATGTHYEAGRNVPGTYGGAEENVVDQIRDPNSDFYRDMYNRMRVQMEKSKEEQEKQAIIDALDAILESLSTKKDDYPPKKATVRSMAELSETIDSLDKDDPRKEQLNLLRERLQNLGIYADLDVGVKDEDKTGETLTQSLIREETEDPDLSTII